MLPSNKYSKIYLAIIEKARQKSRDKKSSYFEAHHIEPRSLGGSNSRTNIVLLTAREHFLCHSLLVKCFKEGSNERIKMLHAFILMKGGNSRQQRYINGRIYDSLKKEYSIQRSISMKGVKHSEERKNNIAKSMTGRKHSSETKSKIAEKASKRKRKPFTEEQKRNIAEGMRRARETR